jgi:hypothetical protein
MEREKAGETNNPTGAGSPEAGAEGLSAAALEEAAEGDGAEVVVVSTAEGEACAEEDEEATGTEPGAGEPKKRVRVWLRSSTTSGEVVDGVVASGDATEGGEKATEGAGKPRAERRRRRARPEKVTRSGKEG